MTPSRDDLLVAADTSVRYHRSRTSFLRLCDRIINWLVLITSASAFLFLVGGENTLFAKVTLAVIALLTITQIAFKLGDAANDHFRWHRGWCELLVDIQTNASPGRGKINEWIKTRKIIESEHPDELRALEVECRNKTIEALNLDEAEIRRIRFWQKPIIQLVSLQQNFPKEIDLQKK